jgi:glyoxylase-like metal-dependent hydrolase (beta-lactamase superfamily II)
VKIWSVDGNSQRLDGGAMFGNVPRAIWKKWVEPDEQNRINLICRGMLAEDLNGQTVLFETGIGTFLEPKLKGRYGVQETEHVLLHSLEARGTSHQDVNVVVLSHLHFDHAGGLLASWQEGQTPELLFPNARFLVGEVAWERARNPHPRDRASFIPALPELLEASGQLELVTGTHSETLGDAVRFSYSDGHTPGLMLSEVGSAVVFCADLIPGRPWMHLPVTMGFDRYPEQLIDEKHAFLDDKIERNVSLFFTHDPGCTVARPVRDEQGRYSTTDELPSLEGLLLN